MGGTGVIDHFLEVFTRYIDSGFGLLKPEVAFIATTLIVIDVTLAALFWSMGGDDDIIARLIKKTLFVGVFAYLIGNWNNLARIIFESFAGLGLKAAGTGFSVSDLLRPGKVAQIGLDAGRPLLDSISDLMGWVSFFENFIQIACLLFAWALILLAFFVLAVQLFVTLIEFKLTTLAGFVLIPFGLFGKSAFMAERVLGNVISSGIKVLVLAVVIGIGSTLFSEFTAGFNGATPTIDDAMAIVLGTQQKVLTNISSLGTNTITVRSGKGFGARDVNKVQTLIPTDVDALALQPYADSASPSVAAKRAVVYRNTSSDASINGVSGDYFQVHNYVTLNGATFGSEDITRRTQVAVIDEDTRDTFFDTAVDPVGKVLLLGGVPVRVIGVVRSSGASFGPESLNVWVPYTTVMARISGQDFLDSVAVRVSDDYDTTLAQTEITDLLTGRHGTKDFFLINSDKIRATITSTTETLTLLVAMIAVISLIVGGIGVMNIMLVSVTERTKEIGVRIAIGARRSDIVAQFLIEAVLVCLTGGVLGIAVALIGGHLVGYVSSGVQLSFSATAIVAAFLSSTLIGITFGYLPARSAAKLDPVVALSRE